MFNLSSTVQETGWTGDASYRDKGTFREYRQEVWCSGEKNG